MSQVAVSHLSSVPYLYCSEGDDRVVALQPYWDGERWSFWLPNPEGGLLLVHPVDVGEGKYVAAAPARETDLHLPFLDFMWKRASWPEVTRWLAAIEDDIIRVAASLAKIDHFGACAGVSEHDGSHIFVATEIEYLFVRCRGVFDHLQHIIAALWARVEIVDPADARRKRKLPDDSFRRVAEKVRDRVAEAPAPYGLPDALVEAYARVQPFFFSLRKLRDQLTHRGGNVGRVYVTQRGYAIEAQGRLADLSPAPGTDHSFNEKLVALRPTLAHVVFSTLYALNDFASAFGRVIRFLDSLIPNHAVYLRAPHAEALVEAQRVLKGANPWKSAGDAVPSPQDHRT